MSQETAPSDVLKNELGLIEDLRYEVGAELASHTTLQIGGPARYFATVSTQRALERLVNLGRVLDVPLNLLGLGSNVLVPDQGLGGVTFRLDGDFRRLEVHGDRVRVGAALPLGQLARRMSARGLRGLEPLSGFPSTVGGAVFMNAGCYGTEIAELLETVTVVDRDGEVREMSTAEIEPSYRSTRLQRGDDIVAEATLRLRPGDSKEALEEIALLQRQRRSSMPREPNAGSIFRNPPGDFAGRLIDQAGLRGLRIGGAQISHTHANVIVNRGDARALDVLELMVKMRDGVAQSHGVELETEIVLAGTLRTEWQRRRDTFYEGSKDNLGKGERS